jgi:hypothetical protein
MYFFEFQGSKPMPWLRASGSATARASQGGTALASVLTTIAFSLSISSANSSPTSGTLPSFDIKAKYQISIYQQYQIPNLDIKGQCFSFDIGYDIYLQYWRSIVDSVL